DLATGWQAGIALALTLSIRRTRTRAGAGMAHNPVLCLFGLRRGTVVQHKHCDDGGVSGSSGQGSRIERGGAMRVGSWSGAVLRQALVAGVYLAVLFLFRVVSIQHWFILTGFHLVVLMLVPYRYWPALFIGDTALLVYVSISRLDHYGLLWAAVNTIPSIAYEAPVVWWFRERWRLFPTRKTVNMPILVLCALIVA